MKTLIKLALGSLMMAAPSLVFGQKPAKVHTPPVHVIKPHTVATPAQKNDVVKDVTKRNEKLAEKTEKSEERTEHLELKAALAEHRLDHGLKLTASQRHQWESIERNYDTQYRNLGKTEHAADRTARKTHTVDDDATFNAQLSSLDLNERNALRATLTPQQQSIFDANVAKFSKPKH